MMTAPAVGADLPDGISSYALTVTVEDYYDRGVFAYQDDDFTEYSYLVDVEKGKDNAYYRVSMPDMPDVLVMDKSLHRLQKALVSVSGASLPAQPCGLQLVTYVHSTGCRATGHSGHIHCPALSHT
jgi:hypothetical protein